MNKSRWYKLGTVVAFAFIVILIWSFRSEIVGRVRGMVFDEFLDRINILERLNEDKEIHHRAITDSLRQGYTKTTTEKKDLERTLERLARRYNNELESLTDSLEALGQKLTATTTGSGDIDLGGGGLADTTFEDSFLRATLKFFPLFPTGVDSILFDYQLTAVLKHYDIEYTDKYGNKTHLNRFWLESTRDKRKFNIAVIDSSYELKEEVDIFHWINPKFHGKLISASKLGGGMGVNLGTIGWGVRIEQSWVYFIEGGVAVFEDNSFGVYLMPIDINVGSFLPVVSNLNIGPMILFDDIWRFGGSIGAVF